MTGRVCPVHGEYSATGACRWCEKPSGADQSTITLPLLCICKTCLRGFDAPIPLTSLVCPECMAKAPRKVHPDVPKGSMFCRCGDCAWAPWCPPDERQGVIGGVAHSPEQCFKLAGESPGASALRDAAELARYIALFPAAQEYLLAQEHAALRWERVARRWAAKGPPPRKHRETVAGELAFDDHCAECLRLKRLVSAGIPEEWP